VIHAEEHWREPRALRILCTGVLIGPAVWAVNLQTNYTLATFACEGRWPLLLHAVTILSLLVAGGGAWLSWRAWQAIGGAPYDAGEHEPRDRIARTRFMAASGFVLSAFFMLTIAAQWIPTFFQEPCHY